MLPEALLIASHNKGKVREIGELLAPLGIRVISAAELNLPEPEETGATFAENAELKALAAAKASGLPALSDDSGLCVEALGGAPGIYSARWTGADKNYASAFARIQRELAERGNTDAHPAACFICDLCLAWPEGKTVHFEGRVDGTLTFPPRGEHGFGYDPIFMPEGHAHTFGEIPAAQKHSMSHRARAFSQLVAFWTKQA